MGMGMLSPGGGMWRYSYTRSAIIRLRVTRAVGGARSTAALYHPFIQCQASLLRGGSAPSNRYTSSSASSFRCRLSSFSLAFIPRPSLLMWAWSLVGSRRAETLLLTSLHVAADIQAFFLASKDLGFVVALRRSTKSPYSLVRVVGVHRGSRMRILR